MIVLRAIRRWRGVFVIARRWMPLALEAAVTLASAQMAYLFVQDQGYFDRSRDFYSFLLAHFPGEEWKWAVLASLAAALKGVGMGMMFFRRQESVIEAAFVLRGIGWGLSCVFWSTFALSLYFSEVRSVGAITCSAMAQLSLIALVMGPAMPEAPDARLDG